MASALAALANATVTLEVAAAGTVTDARGNVVPATESVTVSMYLRQGGVAFEGGTSLTDLPGIEAARELYEGYAVDPQSLDARIVNGTPGAIVFSGQPSQRCEIVSARYPYGTTGLLGSTIQQVLGDKVRIAVYGQQ
jgi:hypothetical protein